MFLDAIKELIPLLVTSLIGALTLSIRNLHKSYNEEQKRKAISKVTHGHYLEAVQSSRGLSADDVAVEIEQIAKSAIAEVVSQGFNVTDADIERAKRIARALESDKVTPSIQKSQEQNVPTEKDCDTKCRVAKKKTPPRGKK